MFYTLFFLYFSARSAEKMFLHAISVVGAAQNLQEKIVVYRPECLYVDVKHVDAKHVDVKHQHVSHQHVCCET